MITIKKDLTDVKVADRKKQILNVIHKWLIEVNENRQEFREEFLSDKNDKYFNELKESIGEFEEIKDMSILDFLGEVIFYSAIGKESKFKIINELQKEFQKLREDFYKREWKGDKK